MPIPQVDDSLCRLIRSDRNFDVDHAWEVTKHVLDSPLRVVHAGAQPDRNQGADSIQQYPNDSEPFTV